MLDWLRRKLGSGPDRALDWRRRVASFRRLLGRSAELCGLVAELEAELRVAGPDEPRVRERMRRALATSLDLVQDLSELRGGGVEDLFAAHERLEREVAGRLRRAQRPPSLPLVVAIEAPEARSREQAGGKAGNLAELRTVLPHAVPPGFVATTAAYRAVAGAAGLPDKLVGLLVAGRGGEAALAERAAELRRLIETTSVPEPLAQAIAAHGAQFPEARRWAVRSSGVGEDGTLSFAGQFDTLLGVLPQGLVDAYRAVVASRFSERALAYCQGAGLAVLGTPMAVLFLPMIPAAAAGVLYTRDPHDPHAPTMWIAATWGLGLDLVGGRASADLFVVAREPAGRIIETRLARKETAIELAEDSPGLASRTLGPEQRDSPALDAAAVRELALLGLRAERHFGGAQDIEWALDRAGKLWLVQSRPLVLSAGRAPAAARHRVLLHGRPLAPGRAVGHVHRALTDAEIDATPEGAVLVVRQATAELARVLGRLGAVVAELGQNDGAALLRQAGVPAVGDAAGAFARLEPGEPASVDGSRGEIYAGILWPELRAPRRGAGIQSPDARFFHDRIVRLALVDPATGNPRGEGCGSVHDLGRLVHERAVDAMLGLGERRSRARRLDAPLPLDLRLLDLGGAVAEQARAAARVSPEAIASVPFAALWRGIVDPRIGWQGSGLDRVGGQGRLLVAPDYVHVRFWHAGESAVIEAVLGELRDNNYVACRFSGGEAAARRRELRARFLAEVLARLGFSADRRADLVDARLQGVPRPSGEEALGHVGRLLACVPRLDLRLDTEAAVAPYVESFLVEDYGRFA